MYADSSLIKRDPKENLVSTGWYRTKFFPTPEIWKISVLKESVKMDTGQIRYVSKN